MADFTKTLTNSIRLFGPGAATKWGQANGVPYTMVWGTNSWGEGFSLVIDVRKLIGNSLSIDSQIYKYPTKYISNSFAVTSTLAIERLSDGIWNYVFVSDTTNAEERDFATWSSQSTSTVTFTSVAAQSTTWT